MNDASGRRPIETILDRARWAPSGDNRQTWRFEVVADDHVVVHAFDTRDDCVYDLDGTASQIALGALLATMEVAASAEGFRIDCARRPESSIEEPLVDVRLIEDRALESSVLAPFIETRSVNRRPLSTRPLTDDERSALGDAVGPAHELVLREDPAARRRVASLLFASAKLRLTMPEAYAVHRDAIEWGVQFSQDRVPAAAVGLDPMTARLMQWVMKSWPRVSFFNRYLAGTWIPRVQLDVLPALRCATHFVVLARKTPVDIDDFIEAGRAVQRLWLTATRFGLQLQPEQTPLIFARYHRTQLPFSELPGAMDKAGRIAKRIAREIGETAASNAVFMGRIGAGPAATSRSTRLPLASLMVASADAGTTGDQKLRRAST